VENIEKMVVEKSTCKIKVASSPSGLIDNFPYEIESYLFSIRNRAISGQKNIP
jgi:hypothetical protein